MFASLFGAKKEAPKAKAAPDIVGAQDKLQTQVENIDMRIKKIENDVGALKKQAVEKKKKKDDRGAIAALRKAKMYEKELAKLEGQSMMLEQ
jgi:hypothetical protein